MILPRFVSAISSEQDFLNFLRETAPDKGLGWDIPENVFSFQDISFPSDLVSEFKFSEKETRLEVAQLAPMAASQPMGIYLVKFATSRPYVTHLRKIVRGIEPSLRKAAHLPSFSLQNTLLICTPDWKDYTFAHFKGEKWNTAKLSTFGWEHGSTYLRTVCEHNLTALRFPEDQSQWREQWLKAWDVQALTDSFYDQLQKVFEAIQKSIHGLNDENKSLFAQLLLNRLLFLKFLERKGWLFFDPNDTLSERRQFLNRKRAQFQNQNEWSEFFWHLFFHGLNQRNGGGNERIGYVPFLNGGLFEESKDWNDRAVKVDNEVFDQIFSCLLNAYNFTIQENLYDVEVALNPDLLGYAYEEFIFYQHGQGAYYTPPTEVGLMCREALKTSLEENTSIKALTISELVDEHLVHNLADDEALAIYKKLFSLKCLDPAVGSGAYPMRMLQELVAIYEVLAERMSNGQFRYIFDKKNFNPKSRFDLKLAIMQNNLYGVDIDYHAVEIAKLRFWLSLVVDFNEPVNSPDDFEKIPALPNLDFKLRTGESLVSALGKGGKMKDQLVNLDTHFQPPATIDVFFAAKTKELREIKNQYFNLEERKKHDPRLANVTKADLRQQIAQKEQEIARDLGFEMNGEVEDAKRLKHILWPIHFAEVFDESAKAYGFDICIANPPYLRQEKIDELFAQFQLAIDKDELVKTYEQLFAGHILKMDKKSDLYVYFFLRGLYLLKEKGVLCYICSNSWLDVGYGGKLQQIFLRTAHVKAIFDNNAMRSFKKADVNTTINLFVKTSTAAKQTFEKGKKLVEITTPNTARFVMFRRPFEEAAQAAHLREIHTATTITSNDNYRVYPITQKELWHAGLEENEDGEVLFGGDKWGGKYLRAPDIFFTILEKGKDKLVRLGDIAEVRRGFTTGANEFFYLDEQRIAEWKIEKEFLQPVIKSPRECKRILVDSKELKYKIFLCHKDKKELKGTNALKYIEWGEKQGFCENETVKNRRLWYACSMDLSGNTFWVKETNNRIGAFISERRMLADCRLYFAACTVKIQNLVNSTLSALLSEVLSRAGLGEGARSLMVYEVNKFLIPSPSIFEFQKFFLSDRRLCSIFEECGLNELCTLRTQQPNPLPDRKALDDVIFDALGLTPAERKEVYWAVCELVQNRLNKAKSFSSKKRSEHANEEEITVAKNIQQRRPMEKAGEIKRRETKAA